MFDANRDGLARHSDSTGLSSGLIGSSPKFMAVFEEARKGAFTRAVAQMLGRFEAANRETLFLDEIGAVNLQAKLLLVLVLIENKISTIVRTEFRLTGEGHDIQTL
jgi:sigma54-dependent transcription regulator